ncbi:MAG: NAD(P)H dehydrogenase [Clostridiaceae bacterium]|jgi:multimeric flavodoxin WrbA/putative sterol carrier protein|nr:NAD(P)H dehydrogenase [Clostridiaceae bacterium]
MNILVVNGSPKGAKSNTLRLTDAFLEGICSVEKDATPVISKLDIVKKDATPVIEKLNTAQMDIKSCLGCFSCWTKTPGKCCIHDDMQKVLEKILWADLTIWSFPLYYFNVPGKLKTLIDRQLPLMLPFMSSDTESGGHPLRYDMSGKKTVLISTCGFYTAESNYDSVIAQFDKIYGKGEYTTLFCGQGELFRVPELSSRTDEYLAVVRQAGQEYVSGGISEKTNVKLQELLFPRDVFERMADASWGVSETGEKEDVSLTFTKQMAALYNPSAYKGTDLVFDMDYTDIGKRYRIVLGKTKSRVLEEFEGKPATVIHTPLSVWQDIAAGKIGGPDALMKHLYSVEGDFDLMLKWDDYFGQKQNKNSIEDNNKPPTIAKTDMRYMLIPWIVFWVVANIHTFWGSVISIFVCSAVPLLFYKNKKTLYDVISGIMVSSFSILLLINVSTAVVIPLSYLAFGVMWSASVFFKIPLTAEYSLNDYGGDSALRNPLFIKTNRILTAAWGILYLITPIWTLFIMRTEAGRYIGAINAILPLFMGIFTAWFQKWYPKKVAKGAKK